jgi:hypothetical protein
MNATASQADGNTSRVCHESCLAASDVVRINFLPGRERQPAWIGRGFRFMDVIVRFVPQRQFLRADPHNTNGRHQIPNWSLRHNPRGFAAPHVRTGNRQAAPRTTCHNCHSTANKYTACTYVMRTAVCDDDVASRGRRLIPVFAFPENFVCSGFNDESDSNGGSDCAT